MNKQKKNTLVKTKYLKVKKETKINKVFLIVFVCILLFIMIYGVNFFIKGNNELNNNDSIAWGNSEPIACCEFAIYFPKHKADVVSYIKNKYGENDSKDFWTKDFGNGDIPINLAKKATLEEIELVKL